ncbi:MAG: aminotransferase class I/II-fold pyridoxal phosphate-dependent enzyme, partial [Eubacteriales bacterium]|nr:aminotransferase class I/II-fold pyridoxal phosphate-dependent enzyme [Eubacteriales bacterium]
IITKNKLDYFLSNIPENIVIILDEAYYEYACIHQDYPNGLDILEKRENTIVVRTFSKIAGLAGLRIGFAVSSEAIIEAMLKIKQTFNAGSLSQEAALGAIMDKAHIRKTVELNSASMRRMETGFDEMGLYYIKSYTNFIFVDTGKDSQAIYEQLMSRGFIVKPGAIWGYKSWVRVSTGTLEQTEKFIGTLKKILERRG